MLLCLLGILTNGLRLFLLPSCIFYGGIVESDDGTVDVYFSGTDITGDYIGESLIRNIST